MSNKDMPYFTIIIATYNAASTIRKSIESVLAQTESAQVLVMDGLSTDDTVVFAREYGTRGVSVYSEKDTGVYDAWNKGLVHARGEWIIFLGADDYYDNPQSLSTLRHALETTPPETRLAYGLVEVVNASGKLIAVENKPWNECRHVLRKNMPYTHVGSAHHASLFLKRRFDSSFKIAGDYNFLYPVLISSTPVFVCNYVAKMGVGGLSTAVGARRKLISELRLIKKIHKIDAGWFSDFWLVLKDVYYFSFEKYLAFVRR